jgi:hypothetical protein
MHDLHVHTAGDRKIHTLHVHTGSGKAYTLNTARPLLAVEMVTPIKFV